MGYFDNLFTNNLYGLVVTEENATSSVYLGNVDGEIYNGTLIWNNLSDFDPETYTGYMHSIVVGGESLVMPPAEQGYDLPFATF